MITAWSIYILGCTLLMLAIDFGWPKWLPPTTEPGVFAFAFGGEALMFIGILLIKKAL
jgi:hypothetical protein